jgi:hypothetical protein
VSVMIKMRGIAKIDFGAPNSYSTITRKELERIRDNANKNFDFEKFGIQKPVKKSKV